MVAHVYRPGGPLETTVQSACNAGKGVSRPSIRFDTKTNVVFRRRLNPSEFSVETSSAGTNRTWLRLMRKGNTFIGHASANGLDWQYLWFTTLSLSNQVHIGLAVTAHQFSQVATGIFDNVSITPLSPLPGVWPLPRPQILLGGEGGKPGEFARVGGFKFLVGGVAGDSFRIRSSPIVDAPSNSWTFLGTVTNRLGVVEFVDSQALSNSVRFYGVDRGAP